MGYSELCGFTIFGLHGLRWSFLGISGRWYVGMAGGAWSAVMFARRVHVRPGLVHILIGASVGLTYIWIMSLSLSGHWSWWGMSRYLVLAVVASLATKAFNADVKRGMRSRSERATRLARQVSAGNAPRQDFALYLRPFKSTDHLPAAFLPSERGMGSDGGTEHLDIETVLHRRRNESPASTHELIS